MDSDTWGTLAWGTLAIRRTQIGTTPRLMLSGVVNVASAPLFRKQLDTILETGPARLLVDLNEVTYIDSTGLDVLVGARQRLLQQNGTLALLCGEPAILKILDSTGVRTQFDLYQNAADLVNSTDDVLRGELDWSVG